MYSFYQGKVQIHANGARVAKATCTKYDACTQKYASAGDGDTHGRTDAIITSELEVLPKRYL